MNAPSLKKPFLYGFIAFLTLTALIGLSAVFSGEVGELQVKVLVTTFAISCGAILSMACAAFIEKGRGTSAGWTGITLATLAVLLFIFGVWTEPRSDLYWRTLGCVVTLAIAGSHSMLLLLARLAPAHRPVQPVAVAFIGALAATVITAILADIDSDGIFRVIAGLSILVGLFTLVIPILAKVRGGVKPPVGGPSPAPATLELIREADDRYRDPSGKAYRVTPLDS